MAKESDGRLVRTPYGEDLWLFWGGFLSQWFLCAGKGVQFVIDDLPYNCAEQWMMAEKARMFQDPVALAGILGTPWPKAQKEWGRKVRNFDPAVWEVNAQGIVRRGNMAKFGQNANLREKLFALPDQIAEASPYDTIWGIGLGEDDPLAADPVKWRGTNLLGITIAQVRRLLLNEEDFV